MGKDAAWPSSPTEDIPILSYLQGLEEADGPKSRAFISIFLFSCHRGILQFSPPFPFFKTGVADHEHGHDSWMSFAFSRTL